MKYKLKTPSKCLLFALLFVQFLTVSFTGSSVNAVAVEGTVNVCSSPLAQSSYESILTSRSIDKVVSSYVLLYSKYNEYHLYASPNNITIQTNGYVSFPANTTKYVISTASPYNTVYSQDISNDYANYQLHDNAENNCVHMAHNWDKTNFTSQSLTPPTLPDPFSTQQQLPPGYKLFTVSPTLEMTLYGIDGEEKHKKDYAQDYIAYIADPQYWFYPEQFDDPNSHFRQTYDSFMQAIETGKYGTVSYHSPPDENGKINKSIMVYWSHDPSATLIPFYQNPGDTIPAGLTASAPTGLIEFSLQDPENDGVWIPRINMTGIFSNPTAQNLILATSDTSPHTWKYLPHFSEFQLDDAGYNHDTLPGRNPAYDAPSFKYEISNLDITLTNTTDGYTTSEFTCHWEIDNDPDQAGDNSYDVMQGDFPCDQQVKHTFPELGYYYVSLYLVREGVTYQTTHNFHIDGSTFSGSVGYAGNDQNSIYKDCSGLDMVAAFGCHLDNFATTVKTFILYLFKPSPDTIKNKLTEFLEVMKNTLGFLWYPFDFIGDILNLMKTQYSSEVGQSCYIGSMSVYGSSSQPLYLCAWRHQLPQLWTLTQTVVQGGLSLVMVSMLFRKISSIIGGDSGGDDTEHSTTISHSTAGKAH